MDANGMWRDPQAELEPQFVGNAFFAPGRIFVGHAANELPRLHGNPKAPLARFVAPEQASLLGASG
jgi:hypothetical protein